MRIGDRAADELAQRHTDEEGRQGELHLGGAGPEVLADPGEGGDVHVRGERGDGTDEDHGGQDHCTEGSGGG